MILISRLKAGIHERLSHCSSAVCESLVQASFRRMSDYCDRIQLVKITEELNSEDFVCKMEEAEDEMKTNDEMDEFFVYNFGLDQRPRQKARSRNRLNKNHDTLKIDLASMLRRCG